MVCAATGNAGPAFGDQPSRAGLIYTTVQGSEQHERAGFSSFFLSPTCLVLVRRLWAGLVFDEVCPFFFFFFPLVTQPLSLGRLGVALVVVV